MIEHCSEWLAQNRDNCSLKMNNKWSAGIIQLPSLKKGNFSLLLFGFYNKTSSIILCLYLPVALLSPDNPAMPGLLAIFAPLEIIFVLFPSIWFNWLAVPAALGPPFTLVCLLVLVKNYRHKIWFVFGCEL